MHFINYCGVALLVLVPSILNAQIYQAAPGTTSTFATQNFANNNQIQNQLSAIPNDNIFLEYYAKQGDDFNASVYYNESGELAKRDISFDDLKKTVVIFSGDWCPYCHNFLTNFSQYINTLNSKGIKIIIVNVPSIDKLRNFVAPTTDDYNEVKSKLESYGINFSSMTKLALLGEKATLARNGIEGLPVFIAIKNGKEYFRGIGQTGVSKLQLSNQTVLKQFLEIWDEEVDQSKSNKEIQKPISQKKSITKPRKQKQQNTKIYKLNKPKKTKVKSKVDISASKNATELLNSISWSAQKLNTEYNHKHTRNCGCKLR